MPSPSLRRLLSTFLPSLPAPMAGDDVSRRLDSCPPLAMRRRMGLRPRIARMLLGRDALATARFDFAEALFDVRTPAALDVQTRIAVTRSLHDLWHFREEVFSLVAVRHDQKEALRRMASLNRHFQRRPAFARIEPRDQTERR